MMPNDKATLNAASKANSSSGDATASGKNDPSANKAKEVAIIKPNNNRSTKKASTSSEDEESGSQCGFFRKAIPIMPKSLAVACCIMNILFPGLGTLISSFSIFFCATHKYQTNLKAFLINMLAFLMQLFSAIIIFGWVWSIKYGLLFVHLADKKDNIDIEPDLPLFVRRHSSMETTMYNAAKPRLSAIALAKVNEDEPA